MDLKLKLILLTLSIVFFVIVLIALRKNVLRPSFALLWLLMALVLMTIPLFEEFYRWVACTLVGFNDARHVIYILLIGFLLVYVLLLTIKISQMQKYIHELISCTAVTEHLREKNIKSDDP